MLIVGKGLPGNDQWAGVVHGGRWYIGGLGEVEVGEPPGCGTHVYLLRELSPACGVRTQRAVRIRNWHTIHSDDIRMREKRTINILYFVCFPVTKPKASFRLEFGRLLRYHTDHEISLQVPCNKEGLASCSVDIGWNPSRGLWAHLLVLTCLSAWDRHRMYRVNCKVPS